MNRFLSTLALGAALLCACTPGGPTSFELPPRETALKAPENGTLGGSVTVAGLDAAAAKGIELSLQSQGGGRALTATTDSAGAFRFEPVPPGEYVLALTGQTFRSNALPKPLHVGSGEVAAGTFELIPDTASGGRISGKVRVAGDAPVKDILVEFRLQPKNDVFASVTVTPDSGEFSAALPAGTWNLKASHPSYVDALASNVTLAAKEEKALAQPLLLGINPATLQGTILRESDFSPVAFALGATVSVDDQPGTPADVNGRYAFTGLLAGTHLVRLALAGHHDPIPVHAVTLKAGSPTTLDVTLTRDRGSITGTVKLSDGKAAQGISVALDSGPAGSGRYSAVAAPLAGNPSIASYSFQNLPTGKYAISYDKERYASKTDAVTVTSGSNNDLPTLSLVLLQGDFLIEDSDPLNTPGYTRGTQVSLKFVTLPPGAACYYVAEDETLLAPPAADGGAPDAARPSLPCKPLPAGSVDAYTLATAQDGTHQLFVQFEDGSGKRSLTNRAAIVLDTRPPELKLEVEGGAGFTRNAQSLSLTVQGTDAKKTGADTASNVGSMVFNFDGALESAAVADAGTPGDAGTSSPAALCKGAASLTGLLKGAGPRTPYLRDFGLQRPSSGDGPVQVFAQIFDNAGNPSAIVCQEVVVDTVNPSASFTIQRGALATRAGYTASPIVFLSTTSVAEPNGGYILVRLAGSLNDLATSVFTPLKPTVTFFLDGPTVDETKTIYAEFRDAAGNRFSPPSQDIVLDLVPPAPVSATVPASSSTAAISVALSAQDNHGLSDTEAVTVSEDPFFAAAGTVGPQVIPASGNLSFTLSPGDETKKIYVRYKDHAGNVSSVQRSLLFDTTAPGATLVAGDGSAYFAQKIPVPLTLANPSGDLTAVALSTGTLDCLNGATVYQPFTGAPLSMALADGTFKISACLRDAVGNRSPTPLSVALVVDTTPPTGTVQVPAQFTSSSLVTVQIAASDATSGVDRMEVTDAPAFSSKWVAFSPSFQLKLSGADGPRAVHTQLMDRAGNIAVLADASITFDTTPPGGSLAIKVGGTVSPVSTTTTAITLVHTTASDVVQVAVASDSLDCAAPPAPGYHPFAATEAFTLPSGDGKKTVAACYRDGAGNISSATASVVLDTTAPAGSLTVNGGQPVTSATSTPITLAASSDVVSMALTQTATRTTPDCTTAGYTAFTPNTSVALGFDGTTFIAVCLKDGAGLTSLAPLLGQVIRDRAAPTGALRINGSAAPPPTATPSVTLSLTALADATTQVVDVAFASDLASITTAPFEPLSAQRGWTLTPGDGVKLVVARIRDAAGNFADLQASITFDTLAPALTAMVRSSSGGTALKIGDDARTLVLTVAGLTTADVAGARLAYAVQAGTAFPDCSTLPYNDPFVAQSLTVTTVNATPLGDGTWNVLACVKDPAGNIGRLVTSIAVDLSPPGATLTLGDGSTFSRFPALPILLGAPSSDLSQVAFSFTNPGAAGCSSALFTYAPYAPPLSQTLSSPDGAKTVYVCLKDAVGNVSAPLSGVITLDTTPPSGTLALAGGLGATNATSVTLALTGSDATSGVTSMEIVNGAAFSSVFVPFKASPTWQLPAGDGLKTVSAKLRDAAGNETTLTTLSVTLDTVAPQGSVAIRVAGVISPTATNQLGDAVDVNAVALVVTASSDATLLAVRPGSINCATVTPYNAIQPVVAVALPPGDGLKVMAVCFKDAAGNTSSASASILLDTVAPVVPPGDVPLTIIGTDLLNDFIKTPATTLRLSMSGATQVRLDNSTGGSSCPVSTVWQPLSAYTSWVLAGGPDGLRTVYAEFRDDAGNKSSQCYAKAITLDSTPPSSPRFLTTSKAVNGSATTVRLAAAVTDTNFSHYQISVSGQGALCGNGFQTPDPLIGTGNGCDASSCFCKIASTTAFPVGLASDTMNVVRVRAVDKAGNISADDTVLIRQDSLPPSAPVLDQPLLPVNTSTTVLHISAAATDLYVGAGGVIFEGAGVAGYQLCSCDPDPTHTNPCVQPTVPKGPYSCVIPGTRDFTPLVGQNDFVAPLPINRTTVFFVRAIDGAGNPGPDVQVSVVQDSVKPSRPSISPRDFNVIADSIYVEMVAVSVDDAGTRPVNHHEYLGGKATSWTVLPLQPSTRFFEFPLVRDTVNVLQVRGVDDAGNAGDPTAALVINEQSSRALTLTAPALDPTNFHPALWGDRVVYRGGSGSVGLVNVGTGANTSVVSASISLSTDLTFAGYGTRFVWESSSGQLAGVDLTLSDPLGLVQSVVYPGVATSPSLFGRTLAFLAADDLFTCDIKSCTAPRAITSNGATGPERNPRVTGSLLAYQCTPRLDTVCAFDLGTDSALPPAGTTGRGTLRQFDASGRQVVTNDFVTPDWRLDLTTYGASTITSQRNLGPIAIPVLALAFQGTRSVATFNADGTARLYGQSTAAGSEFSPITTDRHPVTSSVPAVSFNRAAYLTAPETTSTPQTLRVSDLSNMRTVTSGTVDSFSPDVDGDWLVYTSPVPGDSQLHFLNTRSGVDGVAPLRLYNLGVPAISGTQVVFAANQNKSAPFAPGIFACDVSTGCATSTRISGSNGEVQLFDAHLEGNVAVWLSDDDGDGDPATGNINLARVDFTTAPPTITQAATRVVTGRLRRLDLSVVGGQARVVFTDSTGQGNILLWDEAGTLCATTTKFCTLFSAGSTTQSGRGAISGNWVVWTQQVGSTGQPLLFAYDLSVSPAFKYSSGNLTGSLNNPSFEIGGKLAGEASPSSSWAHANPRIDKGRVAWMDNRNNSGLYEPYLYDLNQQLEVRLDLLCTGLGNFPPLLNVSGNRVVWSQPLNHSVIRMWEFQ